MSGQPSKVVIKDAIVKGVKDKKPVVIEEARVEGIAEKMPQPSRAPTTTEQEDITTASQRKVNLIWEYTQAFIAIVVIISNMIAGIFYALTGKTENIPAILSSSLFLIIGFYFSRTNHQAIGGVGKKPTQEYQGR